MCCSPLSLTLPPFLSSFGAINLLQVAIRPPNTLHQEVYAMIEGGWFAVIVLHSQLLIWLD